MLPFEIKKYLFDIAEASDLIGQFVNGKTFADYQKDPLLRSGVERQFEIIGEALNQAIRHNPSLALSISGSSRIISFRNGLFIGMQRFRTKLSGGSWKPIFPYLPAR